MSKLQANEVFKPGAFPKYTYVSRLSTDLNYSYELRLKQALNTPGYLTSIIGPSKTGKTVLCEKVIGLDRMVSLSGNDFKNAKDFWNVIANKVGLSLEGEYAETVSVKGQSLSVEDKSLSTREKYIAGKDKVINSFIENKQVLVLDDFHYAPEEIQFDIAYQLKDAIRREFKAVVISLPHRADDAIRKNADLSGRLNLINIEPWQPNELKEIATTGFQQLEVQISEEFALQIALESLTSPQLMQSICLNLTMLINLDEENSPKAITEQFILEDSYKFTTINLPYREVVKKLKDGPSPRGQKRKTHQLVDGENMDIYSLLLKAIAKNPPVISISLEELKTRVDLLVKVEERIDKKKIKDSLHKLQEIIQASEPIYQVFEWKDSQIYIVDPLFLFYLRWGSY